MPRYGRKSDVDTQSTYPNPEEAEGNETEDPVLVVGIGCLQPPYAAAYHGNARKDIRKNPEARISRAVKVIMRARL